MSFQVKKNIIPVNINDEMKSAYLDYAMSVIVSRALPDVRDGMKPVHRRVLFAMYEQNNHAGKPYKKSARIVGDVLGKYHPHGDVAVYDALVRLAQDFSMRYPLIDGQGNFGSIDGDSPAAMRYTEVRLSKISDSLMQSIEEETVDFIPNYDNSEREPQVLPTIFPQLLVNGQSGIAVGMATNIPPHNLGEILDALLLLVENENASIDELMSFVKGPDFPTSGIICGRKGILDAYRTGRGSILVRGRANVETIKQGKEQIIITELPYQVNKANLIEKIAELVKHEEILGISDIRDESNKEGIRVVIDLKRNENGEVILNHLYKKTRLQDTFGVNIVCIVKGVPKLLNLKECLEAFRDHRYEVIIRRTLFRLRKAKDRLHILEGLKIAVENLDNFVSLIRSSENPEAAKVKLVESYSISEKQAASVLEMRLSRLTALEREKILEEHNQLIVSIADLDDILSRPERVRAITKQEFTSLKDSFADGRLTEIIPDLGSDIDIASLIPPADVFITFSASGYIKRVNEAEFRSQHRAGKGKAGVSLKESDHIKFTFRAHTHDHVLMFSTLGKVYCFRIYELPDASVSSRGKSIAQILTLQAGEEIAVMMPLREFKENSFIFMFTRHGIVKKTELTAFANIRTSGLRAITIDDDDSLLSAMVTSGNDEIIIASEGGMAIRFDENEVRPTGRSARGVIGINLDDNDKVVATALVRPSDELLVVTEFGFGKRSSVEDYRLTTRAKKGVKALRVTSRNGRIAGILVASDNTDVMITTSTGRVLRTPVNSIRVIGRLTQGVCLMRVLETERIVSVCKPNEGDETPVSELEPQEDID